MSSGSPSLRSKRSASRQRMRDRQSTKIASEQGSELATQSVIGEEDTDGILDDLTELFTVSLKPPPSIPVSRRSRSPRALRRSPRGEPPIIVQEINKQSPIQGRILCHPKPKKPKSILLQPDELAPWLIFDPASPWFPSQPTTYQVGIQFGKLSQINDHGRNYYDCCRGNSCWIHSSIS